MTREQEIRTLQSLKGNTYFAQYFGEEDIDTMCENIKNDHPIEIGVHRLEMADDAEQSEKRAIEAEKEKKLVSDRLDELINDIIYKLKNIDDAEMLLTPIIGFNEYIARKLKYGKELTECETELLIEMLTSKK